MSSVLTIRHYLALDPPGAVEANAFQVNAVGDVIGDYFTSSPGANGYLYASGQYTALDGSAVAMNRSGEVVGDTSDNQIFLYDNGTYSTVDYPVDHPASSQFLAAGINDEGDVIGEFTPPGESNLQQVNGFATYLGVYVAIDVPGATFTTLTGINDKGTVAGYFGTSSGGTEGFVYSGGSFYTNGTFTTFAPPGSTDLETFGINRSGEVLGESFATQGSNVIGQGFLYDGGAFTPIKVPGSFRTDVSGLNDSGIVVGTYKGVTGTHGFIDDGGSYTRVDVPNAQATELFSISNQIGTSGSYFVAGYYTDAQDAEHAFRATVALTSISGGSAVLHDILDGAQVSAADLLPSSMAAAMAPPGSTGLAALPDAAGIGSGASLALADVPATQPSPIVGGGGQDGGDRYA